jgi:hypothetical protein
VQVGAVAEQRPAPVKAAAEDQAVGKRAVLTTVDRYYLAWSEYHNEYGHEPTAEQLSAHLAQKNIHGRGGNPVHPSTLRRYLLSYRVYNVWSAYRIRGEPPTADTVAHACTTRGITAQYNKPVTPTYITDNTSDFERRWHTLNHHQPTDNPQQT